MAYAMAVRLTVREGTSARVLELLDQLRLAAEASGECRRFAIHEGSAAPDCIWVYEAYSSREYHEETHLQLPRVQELLAELSPCLAAPWESWVGTTYE